MDNNIKSRIKEIRRSKNLSMEVFGKSIGVGKTAISKLESGENKPSERTLKLICREYNINYSWLYDGVGDMESDFRSSILDDLADEYKLDSVDKQIVENYMKLDPASKKAIKEYLKSLTILWGSED